MHTAIVRQRNAVDVLHHEARTSISESVCVVQPRDGRVYELGQGALFGGKPFAAGLRDPRVAQHLDRDKAPEILALGEVDDSHPALTDHAFNSVRTDVLGQWRGS